MYFFTAIPLVTHLFCNGFRRQETLRCVSATCSIDVAMLQNNPDLFFRQRLKTCFAACVVVITPLPHCRLSALSARCYTFFDPLFSCTLDTKCFGGARGAGKTCCVNPENNRHATWRGLQRRLHPRWAIEQAHRRPGPVGEGGSRAP